MTDVKRLVERLAAEEAEFFKADFLAPCTRSGRLKVRIAGLAVTLRPRPARFEGWGIFRPSGRYADLHRGAEVDEIGGYLQPLPAMRFHLVLRLQHRTWLAYPANEADARQRRFEARPYPVHLVEDANLFDTVVARTDGASWWYEAVDRRADPEPADAMRQALDLLVDPASLTFKGKTPEMAAAYDMAAQQAQAFEALRQRRRDAARLTRALGMAQASLRDFTDRGDHWQVSWTTADGESHVSAIRKGDLTVLSAGICLSDRDPDFDLTSLVTVVERAE